MVHEVVIEKHTHQAHVMMGHTAYGGNDSRHMALVLLNNILGGPAMSSRLNMSLREKRGLVYTVQSTLTTYTDTGVWSIYFGCDHADVDKCRRLVVRELRKLVDAPLSERALNAAKRQLKGQVHLSFENKEDVAIAMGKRMLHYGQFRTAADIIRAIDQLTPECLHKVACDVMNPDNLTILIYV